MKYISSLALIFFLASATNTFAQPGEWTWMSGSSAPNAGGVFGTKGVPSVLNHPPGLYEVSNWTDNQGNFWLYAGIGPNILVYGDLWKFNPVTTEWTWVNGTGGTGIPPVFGIKGVAAATNYPGTRSWGMNNWTDQSGDLWFYGGQTSTGFLSDIWKYNIATDLWTWMGGDTLPGSAGNFGVQGVPSVNNFPPPRAGETATSWIENDNLWLFGGSRDDLWRYTISTGEWTWMLGSQGMAAPVYGIKGVPNPLNTPGSRSTYNHFKDPSGNMWFFGGSTMNDMWMYNVSLNEWAWMSGSNNPNDPGNYVATCQPDSLSMPASRYENQACWTDLCGNFWMLGGNINSGCTNDLWKFNPSTLEWTWVNGTSAGNLPSVYGTLGVSSPANVVGSRMGTCGWVDTNNDLWLFGGSTYGYVQFLADMWRFTPDPSCTPCTVNPVALFSAPNHICPGTCTDFVNLSQNSFTYQWTFPGASPGTSTDVSPVNICYNTPGTYAVSLIASNGITSDTLTLNNFITVYPYPPPQGIAQSGDTLFANPGAVTYQWYMNGVIIPGATNDYYVAMQSGNYNVVATDNNNCEVEAAIFDVIAVVQSATGSQQVLTLFPNPVSGRLEIVNSAFSSTKEIEITVYDVLGSKTFSAVSKFIVANSGIQVDLSELNSGVYFLELHSGADSFRAKFVKQ